MMELQTWTFVLLVAAALCPPAEASTVVSIYDPRLCYVLDGLLGLYGVVITGMFIREKFFRPKVKAGEESIYTDLRGQDDAQYAPLMTTGDAEGGRGRNRAMGDPTYTDLKKRTDGGYQKLPLKKGEKKNEQVYQGLRGASRDTYDSLQMQPLPPR